MGRHLRRIGERSAGCAAADWAGRGRIEHERARHPARQAHHLHIGRCQDGSNSALSVEPCNTWRSAGVAASLNLTSEKVIQEKQQWLYPITVPTPGRVFAPSMICPPTR